MPVRYASILSDTFTRSERNCKISGLLQSPGCLSGENLQQSRGFLFFPRRVCRKLWHPPPSGLFWKLIYIGGLTVSSVFLRPEKRCNLISLHLAFIAAVLLGVLGGTLGVEAASKRARSAEDRTQAEAIPNGPLFTIISLDKQRLAVYGDTGLVAKSPVSTGRKGYSTPGGIFSILEKRRFHRSNLYYNAPMPFMQRLTWSGVALHAGALPGYPASHGCIRMPSSFAKRMFEISKTGQKVLITRQEVTPVALAHPRLPVPKSFPAPDGKAAPEAKVSKSTVSLKTEAKTISSTSQAEKTVAVPEPNANAVAPQSLNPIEFARIMKAQTTAKAKDANLALEAARDEVADKAEEAIDAASELRKVSVALENAKDRFGSLERRIQRVKDQETIQELTVAKTAAEAQVNDIQARMSAAQATKADKTEKAALAAVAMEKAEENKKTLAQEIRMWTRRLEPVSIFISRKTSRLYVRQGLSKVFDAPVTIKDPTAPLGTHFYIATRSDADSKNLQWLSVSIPEAQPEEKREGKGKKKTEREEPAPIVQVATASQALDRIEFPSEAGEKLSELLWTGASLIVSDNAISNETNDFTDFIILTR